MAPRHVYHSARMLWQRRTALSSEASVMDLISLLYSFRKLDKEVNVCRTVVDLKTQNTTGWFLVCERMAPSPVAEATEKEY